MYNTELALKESTERKEIFFLESAEDLESAGQNKLAKQLQDAAAESQAQQEAAAAPGAGGP